MLHSTFQHIPSNTYTILRDWNVLCIHVNTDVSIKYQWKRQKLRTTRIHLFSVQLKNLRSRKKCNMKLKASHVVATHVLRRRSSANIVTSRERLLGSKMSNTARFYICWYHNGTGILPDLMKYVYMNTMRLQWKNSWTLFAKCPTMYYTIPMFSFICIFACIWSNLLL